MNYYLYNSYKTEINLLHKRMKFIRENIQTLNYLNKYIEKNSSTVLQPYRNKYIKLLKKKNKELIEIISKFDYHKSIILEFKLAYIFLPDDLKFYIKQFIDPLD